MKVKPTKTLGSRKRRFEIVNNRTDLDGVVVDGKKLKFGRSGAFTIDDPMKARDIQKEYGQDGNRDVIVVDTDDVKKEPGHTYQFQSKGVPWGTYCDICGKRIEDGEFVCDFHKRSVGDGNQESENEKEVDQESHQKARSIHKKGEAGGYECLAVRQ